MLSHIRANLLLLVLTVVLCCGMYPAVLLLIGQTVFPLQAEGSLIVGDDGQPVGSRLIAQPFAGDGYFHPRPSAVGYNAAASGASNWGANNPLLRKRVVAAIGPMLKYKDGRPVGPDLAEWARTSLIQDRTVITKWAGTDPYLAERWGEANPEFLKAWEEHHRDAVAHWQRGHDGAEVTPTVLAGLFFSSFAKGETTEWPRTDGVALQAACYELWAAAHPNASVEPIPADLVMASGSGLDPDITLKGALYQLDRIARSRAVMKSEIESLLRKHARSPLGGIAGGPLVNVLEVNLELDQKYGRPEKAE
jgi:K+-transporting ATPase ATPase C chain